MADVWNPACYHRFRQERARPFFDLLALVRPAPNLHALDLGCGTGELTRELHRRLQATSTLGIDRSAAMLAQAQACEAEGLQFRAGDIGELELEAPVELVFSNAALHWLDDHARLLGRLRTLLVPGGQLAVQVPANHEHPSHTVAAELAGESPFREALGGFVRRSPVLRPEAYATVLDALGFHEVEVLLRVYPHHLAGPEAVVDWVRGTSLTPYEERLTPALYAQFLESFRGRLLARLTDARPFLFTFNRILFRAVAPD
jgi:trans-aconitate 2-methyltransferase